jgi:hypothetical protein
MGKSHLLIASAIIASLVGCRTSPPARPIARAKVTSSPSTVPALGTTTTAGIGEELLTQGTAKRLDFIVIPEDQKIGPMTVRKGKYPKVEEGSGYRGFRATLAKNEPVVYDLEGRVYLYSKDEGNKTACLSRTNCGELDYSLDQSSSFERSAFHRTLIYSGRIGNRITLGYREFSNDSARPAFNNDVAYDLSESKILGYKGARLEVIQATNTEITYKVLSVFN